MSAANLDWRLCLLQSRHVPICIYCRQEKDDNQFDREHVIPVSLTKRANAMPSLKGVVCEVCNKTLAREIINPWLRQTPEGIMMRGHYNLVRVTPRDDRRKIGARVDRRRVSLDFPELAAEGIAYTFVGHLPDGVHPRPSGHSNPFGFAQVHAQIRLKRPDGTCEYVTGEKLDSPSTDLAGYSSDETTKVIAGSEEVARQVVEAARARGAVVNEYTVHDPSGRLKGELTLNISQSLETRLVAYLSINHLAWRLGREFVMREDFDAIRAVIMDNTHRNIDRSAPYPFPNWMKPVRKLDRLMVFDGTKHMTSCCHVIAHDWGANFENIQTKLTLFGTYTHEMTLTQGFSGLWRGDVAIATIFDWQRGDARPFDFGKRQDRLL